MRQVIKVEIVQAVPPEHEEDVRSLSEEETNARMARINRYIEEMLENELVLYDGSYARVVEHRLEK